jgi:GGDEF domain-containing protein
MLRAVAGAHCIDQHDLHVTTSIGVSIYPDDALDAESLIKNADTAATISVGRCFRSSSQACSKAAYPNRTR